MQCVNYCFNEKYLQDSIEELNKALLRNDLTPKCRRLIKKTIMWLSKYSKRTDVNQQVKRKIICNHEKQETIDVKDLLKKMEKDYCRIDDELYKFITDLYMVVGYKHFSCEYYSDVEPESIVDNSIDVYLKFFPQFEEDALQIINDPRGLIHFSNDVNDESCCLRPLLLDSPLIVVSNYKTQPFSFIHELQHAIECNKKLKTNKYYEETGAILLETLFIDKMIANGDQNSINLYYQRINDSFAKLDFLNCYFLALRELKKYDFCVSKNKLITILQESKLILRESGINNIYNTNLREDLKYLLSFLKSIEVRNKLLQNNQYGWNVLEKLLLNLDTSLSNSSLLCAIYLEVYLDEIEQKKKELISKKKIYKLPK